MKHYRPTTPSRRHTIGVSYRGVITKTEPEKALTKGGKRHVGRNNQGRITVRHKGGGHKRLFRTVDFLYDKKDIPGRVTAIEYDPNRSGFLALVVYRDGEKRYVLASNTMKVGSEVITSVNADLKPGNRLPLNKIPSGTFVYNVELKANGGARIARSAGVFVEIVAHDEGWSQLKMPSGEIRKVVDTGWASIGAVSNEGYKLRNFGKAGRSRWKGIRPTVRGTAMNPVDHPYGGGEGRQPRGRKRAVTLWGKPVGKGQKTRRPKKYSNTFIVERRNKKKNA